MKLKMREKRPYERPQVTIVDMRVQPQLLAGSDPKASINVTYEEEVWP